MDRVSNEKIYELALTVMRQIDQISAKLDDTLAIARDTTVIARNVNVELAAMRNERAQLIQDDARRRGLHQ